MRATEAFFRHVANAFDESESEFSPHENEMTVAQQIAHVAQTNEWYLDGAANPDGFDMNFEAHLAEVLKVTSNAAALEWLGRSFERAKAFLADASNEALEKSLPPGAVLGGVPTKIIFLGIIDHCAHHRGSLSVYLRALGRVPPMPYEPHVEWRP